MIDFARPIWLWALAALPLLGSLFLFSARRRRSALTFFVSADLEEALAPGYSWRRQLAKGLLRLGAFAFLVLAAAGPRFGSQLVKVERQGIDIVVALDTSLSMLAEDVPPNRLEAAKREISDLIGGLKGDRVGLVAFSGEAVPMCPLTVDYDAALMLVRSMDVYTVSEPGTAIASAVQTSVSLFEGSEKGDRVIILVTDGENTSGDLDDAIRLAADKHVRIYPIGLGTPKGELIPERGTDGAVTGYKKDARGETVLSRLDEGALERIAAGTHGKYLPSTSEGLELKVLYDEISGMERKLIKGEFVERKKERFWFPLGLSLLMLLIDTAIGKRGRQAAKENRRILHTGMAAMLTICAALFLTTNANAARSVSRSKVSSGNHAYKDKDYSKAFDLYKSAIGDTVRPPKNAYGAYYNGGNALFQQKKYQSAIDYYQRGYSADSVQTGKMLYNRGNALMKSGKAAEAVESYVQALQYLPDDKDARHNLEMALIQKQQEQKQKQQQKNDKGNKQDQKNGQQQSQPDSSKTGQQDKNGQQQQQKNDKGKKQDQSQAQADSTGQQKPDSSSTPLSGDEKKQLSKEDAMRILQALEDRERQLQQERRKAQFRKLKRSGKDW
jgi:Ca-activated chloride channel family protein